MNNKKKIIISLFIIIVLILSGVIGYYGHEKYVEAKKEEQALIEAKAKKLAQTQFKKLFSDDKQNTIKLEVTKEELKKVKDLFNNIKDKKVKKEYLKRIKNIDDFIIVRDKIRGYIKDGVMISTITDDDITKLQEEYQKLELGFQPLLNNDLTLIINQRQTIKEIEEIANSFFTNGVINANIDVAKFTDLKNRLANLPQRDIALKYNDRVSEIQKQIDKLEAIKKAKIEAERQAAIAAALAESERLKRVNEEIKANNVILTNVPRIDQRNGVLNGCEVASLLMGLQYKGYHYNLTLKDIAEAVPKTNDPHTGFVLDIWGAHPLDQPHWIAPDALSKFGKTYYEGVTDITGASVEDLKSEIDSGNPVIVYGTYGFSNPRGWYGEVPINLHVMLMVGYNKKTGNIIINDPWGGVEIVVSASSFASQYNLMRYAVAIR